MCHQNSPVGAICISSQRCPRSWDLAALDFLFIENVGNLVCPSSYDLGENARAVLLSVTEGEDKPLKYPSIFHTADAVIVTKMDLAQAVEFDSAAAHRNIDSVRPGTWNQFSRG
jgi:hydrogenase nickel incorporation protein HypB